MGTPSAMQEADRPLGGVAPLASRLRSWRTGERRSEADRVRVIVELVSMRIAGDEVRYAIRRSVAPKHGDPEATARAELAIAFPTLWLHRIVVNATSWRYEEGGLVLTFLAYAEDLPLDELPLIIPLARVEAITSGVASVAAHAIRHFAFVVNETPRTYAERLRPETIARLRSLKPQLAGRLRLDAA